MSNATKSRNSFRTAREERRRGAFGYIALNNVEDLFVWIEALLFEDGKPRLYTMSFSNEHSKFRPEVRTAQEAKEVTLSRDGLSCAIQVYDTDGTWALTSHLGTEPGRCAVDEVLRLSQYVVVSDRQLQARGRNADGFPSWRHIQIEPSRPS